MKLYRLAALTLLTLAALVFAVSAAAQVTTTRDCQTTACSFVTDAYPDGEQPVTCRLYNRGTVIVAETPSLVDASNGRRYCWFPSVTLTWGVYLLTARGIGAAGQESGDSNWIDLTSAVPPPPPPPPFLPAPSGLRIE
jgi:hypothetical protein